MARPILKKSRRADAIVWLPPRGDSRPGLSAEARMLAFVRGAGGAWGLERASIETLAQRRSVLLLADARDVTLLAPKLPPLSGARLAQALPNVVEDLLLQEPAACVLALGPSIDDEGRRLVAACDRQWLETALAAFERRGVAVTGIWPAALALPLVPGSWTLACAYDGLALRRGELDAIGWPAGDDEASRVDAVVALLTAAGEAPALRVLIEDDGWRAPVARALAELGLAAPIEPLAAPAESAPVDLLPPLRGRLRGASLGRLDLRRWRWPLALAAACAVVSVIGLNLQWARLSAEQAMLRDALERKFRKAVPSAAVVVDPLLQLRRQVASQRAQGGTSAPDDFVPMLTRLGQALGARAADALAAVEYRDGTMMVRLQPGFADSDAQREALRAACAQQGLAVRFEAGREPVAVVRVQA